MAGQYRSVNGQTFVAGHVRGSHHFTRRQRVLSGVSPCPHNGQMSVRVGRTFVAGWTTTIRAAQSFTDDDTARAVSEGTQTSANGVRSVGRLVRGRRAGSAPTGSASTAGAAGQAGTAGAVLDGGITRVAGHGETTGGVGGGHRHDAPVHLPSQMRREGWMRRARTGRHAGREVSASLRGGSPSVRMSQVAVRSISRGVRRVAAAVSRVMVGVSGGASVMVVSLVVTLVAAIALIVSMLPGWITGGMNEACAQAAPSVASPPPGVTVMNASTTAATFDGAFTPPITGSLQVNSPFGYRIHPVTGGRKLRLR